MREVEQLIFARWIIPVEPKGVVLEDHAIAIDQGSIVELLPAAVAREKYQAATETVLDQHLVTPGLINLHTHAAMALLRGCGDDMALMDWLEQRIWPLEKALMSEEFVLAGSRLACGEMLRGGITCFNDMYFFADATARAVEEYGMRACLGITVFEFPSAWAADAEAYLERGLALRDTLRERPLISFSLAPHAPYTVSDQTFARVISLAEQIDLPISLHLHETTAEIDQEMARSHVRPIERLAGLGLLGPRLIAVHSVHLTQSEIELFAHHGVTIAHCPASNLKLGSGIAPIAAALAAGVRVGIGTDGAASNNRLDMLAEMRLAALLAKGASGNATVFDAHSVLESATLSAARALMLDDKVGSLVAGKRADLVAFDVSAQDLHPIFDIAAHLVFVLGRECVSDVWVDGDLVVQKRQLVQRTARQAEAEGASALSLWQNRLKIQIGSLS
jgi:5-methylthioadenosine/S-adenosylhomocysteine deaminase